MTKMCDLCGGDLLEGFEARPHYYPDLDETLTMLVCSNCLELEDLCRLCHEDVIYRDGLCEMCYEDELAYWDADRADDEEEEEDVCPF